MMMHRTSKALDLTSFISFAEEDDGRGTTGLAAGVAR